MQPLNRNSGRESGLATVELAIVLPLLILLTFGVIEYGWMFLKVQQITNAARQAARVGATPDATATEVNAVVDEILAGARMGDAQRTITINPVGFTTLEPGEHFTVSVSVRYSDIALVGLPMIPVPSNLRSQTTMAKEGP